jgi:hypothetical protein
VSGEYKSFMVDRSKAIQPVSLKLRPIIDRNGELYIVCLAKLTKQSYPVALIMEN